MQTNDSNEWIQAHFVQNESKESAVITEFQKGKTYIFRTAAVNKAGQGPFGDSSKGIMFELPKSPYGKSLVVMINLDSRWCSNPRHTTFHYQRGAGGWFWKQEDILNHLGITMFFVFLFLFVCWFVCLLVGWLVFYNLGSHFVCLFVCLFVCFLNRGYRSSRGRISSSNTIWYWNGWLRPEKIKNPHFEEFTSFHNHKFYGVFFFFYESKPNWNSDMRIIFGGNCNTGLCFALNRPYF